MAEQLLADRYRVTEVKVPGNVYLAADTYRPGYPVCVIRRLQLIHENKLIFQATRQRLRQRLAVLPQLKSHNRIVLFASFFEENRQLYVVEEWVRGYALQRELRLGGRFSPTKTVRLLGEILEVLEVIHSQNIVHGYLTPTSLIRRRSDSQLVLTNLLLGSTLSVQGEYSQGWVVPSPGWGVEESRDCLPYQAPEQRMGKPVLSSDLYALGLIAVQALTGTSPEALAELKTGSSLSVGSGWGEGLGLNPRFEQWVTSLIQPEWRQRPASATIALRSLNQLFLLPNTPVIDPALKANSSDADPLTANKHFRLTTLSKSSNGQRPSQNGSGNKVTDQRSLPVAWPVLKSGLESLHLNVGWKVLVGGLAGVGLVGLGYGFCQLTSVVPISAPGAAPGASPQRTLQAYGQAIQRHPKDHQAYLKRGNLRLELGDATGAIADYSQAIALAPQATAPLVQRGVAYASLNNMSSAIADLDQAIRLDAKLTQAYLHRCRVRMALNQLTEAVQDCSTAINLDPSLEMAYQNRAQVHQRMGNLLAAMADLDFAIALNSASAMAYTQRGQLRQQLSDQMGALEDFQRAIKLAPDYGLAYYHRGVLRLAASPGKISEGDRRSAQQDLQMAASSCLTQRDFTCYQAVQNQLKIFRLEER